MVDKGDPAPRPNRPHQRPADRSAGNIPAPPFSQNWNFCSIFGNFALWFGMIVIGTDIAETYFKNHKGHKGIAAARSQYDAWLKILETSAPKTPEDIKKMHPKASILKSGRVAFNIKANDFRLVALVQYEAGVLFIRFFGSHQEYDEIDAETV